MRNVRGWIIALLTACAAADSGADNGPCPSGRCENGGFLAMETGFTVPLINGEVAQHIGPCGNSGGGPGNTSMRLGSMFCPCHIEVANCPTATCGALPPRMNCSTPDCSDGLGIDTVTSDAEGVDVKLAIDCWGMGGWVELKIVLEPYPSMGQPLPPQVWQGMLADVCPNLGMGAFDQIANFEDLAHGIYAVQLSLGGTGCQTQPGQRIYFSGETENFWLHVGVSPAGGPQVGLEAMTTVP